MQGREARPGRTRKLIHAASLPPCAYFTCLECLKKAKRSWKSHWAAKQEAKKKNVFDIAISFGPESPEEASAKVDSGVCLCIIKKSQSSLCRLHLWSLPSLKGSSSRGSQEAADQGDAIERLAESKGEADISVNLSLLQSTFYIYTCYMSVHPILFYFPSDC